LQRKTIEESNESDDPDESNAREEEEDDEADSFEEKEAAKKKRASKKKKATAKAKRDGLDKEGRELFEEIKKSERDAKMSQKSLDLPAVNKPENSPNELPATIQLSEDVIKSIIKQTLEETHQQPATKKKSKRDKPVSIVVTEIKEWMTGQAKARNLRYTSRSQVPISEFMEDYIEYRLSSRRIPLSEAQKAEVIELAQVSVNFVNRQGSGS